MAKWREDLFWNAFITILIEGCLEIIITVSINLLINLDSVFSKG